MAYEPRAAATIQAAETSSPRDSASTVHPDAPISATRVQMTTVRGFAVRTGWSSRPCGDGRNVEQERWMRYTACVRSTRLILRSLESRDAASPGG
ncbi:hypothetical protein GCM10010321_47040 [Streptomyces chartreusis]|nr:hypothetical protein GCM10010321_47040 [Streptomyces chartreusis]